MIEMVSKSKSKSQSQSMVMLSTAELVEECCGDRCDLRCIKNACALRSVLVRECGSVDVVRWLEETGMHEGLPYDIFMGSRHPAHLRHCRDSPGETVAHDRQPASYCTRQVLASGAMMFTGQSDKVVEGTIGQIHGCYDMPVIIRAVPCPIGNHGTGPSSLEEGWRLAD